MFRTKLIQSLTIIYDLLHLNSVLRIYICWSDPQMNATETQYLSGIMIDESISR
jgi:hypothetical protein